MTTETKSYKMITFTRRITKIYYENAEMTYGEFSKHLRTEGLDGKKITDDETIKKMWDELANSGDDVGNGVARVDTEQEREYDDGDDECWDDDDDLWDFIENYDFDEVLPQCVNAGCLSTTSKEGEKCEWCVKREKEEAEKTPEQKEKEYNEEQERLRKRGLEEEKRAIAMKKQAEEYKKKMEAHWNVCNVESIKTAVDKAKQYFKVEQTEDDEQWKIKAMRNVARHRILDQMAGLVAQLEEVAKW